MTEPSGPEPRPVGVPWSLKDVGWASLLAIALLVALAVPAALLLRGPGGIDGTSEPAALLRLLFSLSELGLFLVPAWVFGVWKPHARWRDLGLRGFNPLIGCLGAMALFVLILAVNLAWAVVLNLLHWEGQPPLRSVFGEGLTGVTLAVLGTGLVAPFAEELFFRGFVFPPLRRRFGLWLAIAIDAVLFALLHLTPTVFPPILAMGAFFCLLYEYADSIWPGILLHSTINMLAVLAAYLASG